MASMEKSLRYFKELRPMAAMHQPIVEMQQYYDNAIEAIQRLIPKEVTPYAPSCDPSDTQIIDCPSCGNTYWSEDWGNLNFCPNCGQAIKVQEEKEESCTVKIEVKKNHETRTL